MGGSDEAYELTLTEQDVTELLSDPAMSVPISERTDVEEEAGSRRAGWSGPA